MAQAAIDREGYTHPEKIYRDLIYAPDDRMSDELCEKRRGLKHMGTVHNGVDLSEEELCWSCGWSVYNQMILSSVSNDLI